MHPLNCLNELHREEIGSDGQMIIDRDVMPKISGSILRLDICRSVAENYPTNQYFIINMGPSLTKDPQAH